MEGGVDNICRARRKAHTGNGVPGCGRGGGVAAREKLELRPPGVKGSGTAGAVKWSGARPACICPGVDGLAA